MLPKADFRHVCGDCGGTLYLSYKDTGKRKTCHVCGSDNITGDEVE